MKDKKYFFVGMRPFCLNKMLELGLDIVKIVTKKDSHVEKECINKGLEYTIINKKQELLDLIKATDFDVLVSNGCPYILPISELRKNDEKYINIHPSLLPDLRGFSPVNGAILFDRPQGATCHYMDDGIDTGDTITQVKVDDNAKDIPLDLLYQLSFMAEAEAFELAYNRNFEPAPIQNKNLDGTIYYSRKPEDQIVNFDDSLEDMLKKIKAYKVDSQYARFIKKDIEYMIKDAQIIVAEILKSKNYKENEIVMLYKNNIVILKDERFVLLRLDKTDNLCIGEILL